MRSVMTGLMRRVIAARSRPHRRALHIACTDVKRSQEQVLAGILSSAAHTVFGRMHGFSSMASPADFQSGVHANTWEDLRPFVDRHEQGEADVLFAGKPLFYATTSGTTGEPKRVPVTEAYRRDCYNGLSDVWLHSMFEDNPGFMNGFDLSMVGKTVEGRTQDGTAVGSLSGQLNGYMPALVKKFRIIPFAAFDIDHYPSKYYALLRIALACPLRWIVAPNPSTLLELARFGQARAEDLIRDIADGTLRDDLQISPDIRRAVERRLRRDRRRATALEKMAAGDDSFTPRGWWPTLQVVNTWKSGNAALYLRRARPLFPETTAFREFGYVATEARAGIVLRNDQEASILTGHLLFFEFVHASDLDSATRRFLLCHELQAGEQYGIFVTTPAGLYRYDMNDIVRVEGFWGTFPMVRFVQKGAGVTSLTGEKLTESQYLVAMEEALAAAGGTAAFHIAFADPAAGCYKVFAELDADGVDRDALAAALDLRLCNLNPEYRAKRASNRLGTPSVVALPTGAFLQFKESRLARGAREGQFKLVHLQQDPAQQAIFESLAGRTAID